MENRDRMVTEICTRNGWTAAKVKQAVSTCIHFGDYTKQTAGIADPWLDRFKVGDVVTTG